MVQKKSLISKPSAAKKAVLTSKTSAPAAAKGTNLSKQAVSLSKRAGGAWDSELPPM